MIHNNINSDQFIPIKTRKKILYTLKNLLDENKDKIINTLWNDLHKPPFETEFMEINQVIHEINVHLDNLDNWIIEKKFINPLQYINISSTGLNSAYIENRALGKVLIIGAWNYPVNLSLLPLIGAISGGNFVTIMFPSLNYTKYTSNLMVALFNKYFKTSPYIQAKIGGRDNITNILKLKWDKIFYTGSSQVGKIIYQKASETLTPVVLELGGKSPCIVDSSVNDLLVKRIVWGKFTNAGQTCICPDYFLVKSDFGEKFIEKLIQTIQEFYGEFEHLIKHSPDFGRIVNIKAYDRLQNILIEDKSNLVYGGKTDKKNLYISPTILNFKNNTEQFLNSASMREEIFGPIIPIYYYDTEDDVQNILIKYKNPLTAYLFCKDPHSIGDTINSGSMVINDTLIQLNSPLPFGGIGKSGMGSYHGKYSFNEFTYKKSVLTKYNWGELELRFPPYNIKWKKVMRQFSNLYISNKSIVKHSMICILSVLVYKLSRYLTIRN